MATYDSDGNTLSKRGGRWGYYDGDEWVPSAPSASASPLQQYMTTGTLPSSAPSPLVLAATAPAVAPNSAVTQQAQPAASPTWSSVQQYMPQGSPIDPDLGATAPGEQTINVPGVGSVTYQWDGRQWEPSIRDDESRTMQVLSPDGSGGISQKAIAYGKSGFGEALRQLYPAAAVALPAILGATGVLSGLSSSGAIAGSEAAANAVGASGGDALGSLIGSNAANWGINVAPEIASLGMTAAAPSISSGATPTIETPTSTAVDASATQAYDPFDYTPPADPYGVQATIDQVSGINSASTGVNDLANIGSSTVGPLSTTSLTDTPLLDQYFNNAGVNLADSGGPLVPGLGSNPAPTFNPIPEVSTTSAPEQPPAPVEDATIKPVTPGLSTLDKLLSTAKLAGKLLPLISMGGLTLSGGQKYKNTGSGSGSGPGGNSIAGSSSLVGRGWRGASPQDASRFKISGYADGGLAEKRRAFFNHLRSGGQLSGQPGGGQSDNVPAMLSPGEYVMDAATVADLGDGDNNEGARRLDQMRQAVRQHKRSGPLSSIPPKAKMPKQYLQKKV